jgi:SnoaL-like domain
MQPMTHEVSFKESRMNSIKIVEDFWTAVWKSRNPDAIVDFVVEDVVITTGGIDIKGRDKFIAWAWDFLSKINDLDFEVLETFQNENGSRVASLWRVTGKNNGMMGTVPDQQPISLTGTAIWSVREDGKLIHNRVERAAWETFLNLTSKKH